MKQKAVELLSSVNLRQTQPRVAILEILLKADAPVTQEQIAEQIGDRLRIKLRFTEL